MRILCCGYRDWAKTIYKKLEDNFHEEHSFLHINSLNQCSRNLIKDFKPDLILWYGWSWIIPEDITKKYYCIMLHPSPLPKYRGGSPIQNQIINGEKVSAVTLFKINNKMDEGDIIKQQSFLLDGGLNNIFDRIIDIGYDLTLEVFHKFPNVNTTKQKGAPTYCQRRSPKQSEIKIEDIKNHSAEFLYNKIRSLQDPYPNAFIICKDGKKLFITESKYEK